MLHQLLTYAKFQWKAQNKHGIHSPFIYHFLDEVVYQKRQKNFTLPIRQRKREYALYQRIFDYFSPQTTFLLNDEAFFHQSFSEYQTRNQKFSILTREKLLEQAAPDAIILNHIKNAADTIYLLEKIQKKNDSFVIIPQLRASKLQREFWKQLVDAPISQVNLEFYHFGICFFRKESQKENFSIRY